MPLWSEPHDQSEQVYECRHCCERVRADHAPQECPDCGGQLQAIHNANAE